MNRSKPKLMWTSSFPGKKCQIIKDLVQSNHSSNTQLQSTVIDQNNTHSEVRGEVFALTNFLQKRENWMVILLLEKKEKKKRTKE